MKPHILTFHGHDLHLYPSGALYWPDQGLLCISDLHLGKSERMARRGGALLPPYETRETLQRLDDQINQTQAVRVVCLGDSFDDSAALDGLDSGERQWLTRMMAGREWIWIAGNHDAGPLDISGTHRSELAIQAITFRHEPIPTAVAEVSGHFHPKHRHAGQSFRCFLVDQSRIILPAFGTYTGGLVSSDRAFSPLLSAGALAVLCLSSSAICVPLNRSSTRSR